MSLRGTVKQLVFEITNDMSIESCKKLRSMLTLLSDPILQIDYFHMFSTSPSNEFLMKYHNMLLISGAIARQDQCAVLARLSDDKSVSTSTIRHCIRLLPKEIHHRIREIAVNSSLTTPEHIIFTPIIFPIEQVMEACVQILKSQKNKRHIEKLALLILFQETYDCPDILTLRKFDSHEVTALKLIMMSSHSSYEESGVMMSSLLNFHKHFFYKLGGDYPSLFFRVVWTVYHNAKKDQTLREIEQTVKIMLFDPPQYSLYAVNFLNSIPFSRYSPTLLEVLLQLIEYTTRQPLDIFKVSSDHYLAIFKHYLSLDKYSPRPIIQYGIKLVEQEELSASQIMIIGEMIQVVFQHPALATVASDLAVLCQLLSRYPLQESLMRVLYRYLTTYCPKKVRTTLYGSSDNSKLSESCASCVYLDSPTLNLARISPTISRQKYAIPNTPYTEFDISLYLSELHLIITLSYFIHLTREEEYFTCAEFKFEALNREYGPIESVFVPILRSGDTISVNVETSYPTSADFQCHVEYTQHKSHYRFLLSHLQIDVNDLLCRMPLNNFTPSLVFEELWNYCEDHQRHDEKGDAMISILKPVEGFNIRLSMFRLPSSGNDVRYMFGLPPKHFVLIAGDTQYSSVRFAIDSWRLFPIVYKLLVEEL